MAAASVPPSPLVTLPWLLRLRWGAVLGQLLTVAVVRWGLEVRLPVTALVGVIGLTAGTNLALWRVLLGPSVPPQRIIGVVLVADTLLLTALLQLSGGPANPFSALYLVHVTLAVVLLGSRWGWAIVALSAACWAQQFVWHVRLPGTEGLASPEWSLHLGGMWLAFVVAAAVTSYFVGRISAELRRRERELAEIQAQMARNEKLASLSTLAAGAAHELGTPLATIAVVAKELERATLRLQDGGRLAEDARLIREQVERCRGILVQMSAKAGENAGELPSSIAIPALLSEVKELLAPEQAAALAIAGESSVPSLVAPRQALVHVLASLVRNAFEASEPGGVSVRLSVLDEGADVGFEVRDTGRGMSADELARAGDPFFSTKPVGRGMGLGLFLARAFAERCGGRLSLTSAPGAGTTAALHLPREGTRTRHEAA